MGVQIFATVGTDEKRKFLKSTFGLSDDRIFNSRNTDFANQISDATNGQGVDVILISLTGDLLDESWRILADGGTMIEIGKKTFWIVTACQWNLLIETFHSDQWICRMRELQTILSLGKNLHAALAVSPIR
jgi:NADPH:quinone reductase and related Zn-dependent oxidoreductases